MNTSRASNYSRRDQVRERHRRQMQRQVYLPMGIAIGVMVVVLIAMVFLFTPFQVGTVSSFMSLLLLVPMALFCIVPYVVLIAFAVGVRKLNVWLPGRFRATRTVVHNANTGSQSLARKVASPIIWINSRAAWLEHLMSQRRPRKSLPPYTTERKS